MRVLCFGHPTVSVDMGPLSKIRVPKAAQTTFTPYYYRLRALVLFILLVFASGAGAVTHPSQNYIPVEPEASHSCGRLPMLLENEAKSADGLTQNYSLLIVDMQVADAYAFLAAALPGTERIMLREGESGIMQIAAHLARSTHTYASITIVSGGADGVIWLGTDALSNATVGLHSDALAAWRTWEPDNADVHLMACNVASTSYGRQFVDTLGGIWKRNVAASTGETSARDWELEYQFGHVSTSVPLNYTRLSTYAGSLDVTVDVAFAPMNFGSVTLVSGTKASIGTVYKYSSIFTKGGVIVDTIYTVTDSANIGAYTSDASAHPSYFEPNHAYLLPGFVEYTFGFFVSGSTTNRVYLKNFVVNIMDNDGINATDREYNDIGAFSYYCIDASTFLTPQQGVKGRARFLGKPGDAPGNFEDTASVVAAFTYPVTTMSLRIGYTGRSIGSRLNVISWGSWAGNFSNPTCFWPPTVTTMLAQTTTPLLSGTIGMTHTDGNQLTVTVNGTMYTYGDGYLDIVNNANWTLQISPSFPLANGTYDVLVNYTNGSLPIADQTTNELTVQAPRPPSLGASSPTTSPTASVSAAASGSASMSGSVTPSNSASNTASSSMSMSMSTSVTISPSLSSSAVPTVVSTTFPSSSVSYSPSPSASPSKPAATVSMSPSPTFPVSATVTTSVSLVISVSSVASPAKSNSYSPSFLSSSSPSTTAMSSLVAFSSMTSSSAATLSINGSVSPSQTTTSPVASIASTSSTMYSLSLSISPSASTTVTQYLNATPTSSNITENTGILVAPVESGLPVLTSSVIVAAAVLLCLCCVGGVLLSIRRRHRYLGEVHPYPTKGMDIHPVILAATAPTKADGERPICIRDDDPVNAQLRVTLSIPSLRGDPLSTALDPATAWSARDVNTPNTARKNVRRKEKIQQVLVVETETEPQPRSSPLKSASFRNSNRTIDLANRVLIEDPVDSSIAMSKFRNPSATPMQRMSASLKARGSLDSQHLYVSPSSLYSLHPPQTPAWTSRRGLLYSVSEHG